MKNLFSLTTLNLIKTTCISMIKDYPMFCRFELTSKCNFRCEFCHIHKKNNIKQDMTTAQVFTVIDALAKAGVSFLYVTGGEPLIREDIAEILKYIKKKHMYVLLATNGSLFIQKFNNIYKYIDNVHFSIQSVNNFEKIAGYTKKEFENICNGIKLATKSKIPIQINIPVDKNNINEMIDIVEFINKNFFVNDIEFLPIELLSSNKEDNEQIRILLPNMENFNNNLSVIKKKYNMKFNIFDNDIKKLKYKYNLKNKEFCKAGNNMLVINSYGELEYPCEFLKMKKTKINSIKDIDEILKNIDKNKVNNNKIKFCKNCTNSCYLQSSYFLTISGFTKIISNFIKSNIFGL